MSVKELKLDESKTFHDYSCGIALKNCRRFPIPMIFAYRKVASSSPVYYSILELYGQRSHYISIKFPLHKAKPSENVLLTVEVAFGVTRFSSHPCFISLFASTSTDSVSSLKDSSVWLNIAVTSVHFTELAYLPGERVNYFRPSARVPNQY